jgi:hypothetical protein
MKLTFQATIGLCMKPLHVMLGDVAGRWYNPLLTVYDWWISVAVRAAEGAYWQIVY